MLGVGGVGLFCGRVHLQTREIKRSQGESGGVKGSQGDQCEPRKNEMK